MKKLLAILLAVMMLFTLAACGGGNEDATTTTGDTTTAAPENPIIRMSTTTSVENSGLLGYLLPIFEQETGYKVEVFAKGTGIAIENAQNGNADLILVHAKASEEKFITDGYGIERIPFMYNYFVVVGPEADPAGIKDSESASAAFEAIRAAKAPFVSRGDDSGTHKAELKLWGENVPDAQTEQWYLSAGSGMADSLRMASEKGAYCLTDKATYLSLAADLDLEIIIEESEDMKNTYSLIECNPEKLDGLNTEGAKAFIDWILTPETSDLIAKYGVEEYGQALFFLEQ